MRYDPPVGTTEQRDSDKVWPQDWVDATGYATLYHDSTGKQAYHTGADLNLNKPIYDADAGKPVYAAADGLVTFAGFKTVWNGIVILKHADGKCTRYAHVANIVVAAGQRVARGQQLASIGHPLNGPNHLHFDIANIDLSSIPGDWPGIDLARLKRDYIDPLPFIIASRKDEPMAVELETTDRLNLRIAPDALANRITVMPNATPVTEVGVSSDGKWSNLNVAAQMNGQAVTLQGWANRQWLRPLAVQPPLVNSLAAKYLLGVHCLNFAEDGADAIANGCRSVHFMDTYLGDWQQHLAHPDLVVMRRHYVDPGANPSPSVQVEKLGIDPNAGKACKSGGMYIVNLANEGDVLGGYGSAESIARVFAWESECARLIHAKAPFVKVALLSVAHGNPDWTRADIRDAFNRHYVPFIEANKDWIVLDSHAYTLGKRFPSHPPSTAKIYAPIWLETRNQLMHSATRIAYPEVADYCCNLSSSPSILHVSGESGVEAGAGGFNWAGYTPSQFKEWCVEWLRLQRNSVAPYRAATIFQYSRRGDWGGYDIRGFKDVLRDLWTNDVATPKSTFMALTSEHYAIDDMPPPGYHPARKEFNVNVTQGI